MAQNAIVSFINILLLSFHLLCIWKVVGSIDQMEVDENDNTEKNGIDPKSKGKRKLYVGSNAMGYRRDHMEVTILNIKTNHIWHP